MAEEISVDEMEPIYGIPPDHRTYPGIMIAQSSVPWTRPPEVWNPIWESGIDGRGEIAAVLDTGVRQHNSLPTPVAAQSFTGERVDDRNGHGTHCSGSVVGRNGIGGAPAADLVIGKVLSNGGSSTNNSTARGLEWVASLIEGGMNIGVCSNSWGGGTQTGSRTTAALKRLESLGCWIVAAAGNSGYRGGGSSVIAPGISPHTVCVSSCTENGAPSGFSSGGPAVDVCDGGSGIISCSISGPDSLTLMSGTSMSTPCAAGSLLLLRQVMLKLGMNVKMTSRELTKFLAESDLLIDRGTPGDDPRYGEGTVDMAKLTNYLAEKALSWS